MLIYYDNNLEPFWHATVRRIIVVVARGGKKVETSLSFHAIENLKWVRHNSIILVVGLEYAARDCIKLTQ